MVGAAEPRLGGGDSHRSSVPAPYFPGCFVPAGCLASISDDTRGTRSSKGLAAGDWGLFGSLPGWQVPAGHTAEVQNSVGGRAWDGAQYAEMDSGASTGLTQTLATQPDTTYALTIRYSARPGLSAAENRVGVYWNGTLLTTLTADGTGASTTAWKGYGAVVRSGSGRATLELRDEGPSNGLGMYVDDVFAHPLTCRLTTSGAWDVPTNWACFPESPHDYYASMKLFTAAVPGVGNRVEIAAGKTVVLSLLSSGLKAGASGVTLRAGASAVISTFTRSEIVESAAAMVAQRPTVPDYGVPSAVLSQPQLVDLAISAWSALEDYRGALAQARLQKMEDAQLAQQQAQLAGLALKVVTYIGTMVLLVAGTLLMTIAAPVAAVAIGTGAVGFVIGAWNG